MDFCGAIREARFFIPLDVNAEPNKTPKDRE